MQTNAAANFVGHFATFCNKVVHVEKEATITGGDGLMAGDEVIHTAVGNSGRDHGQGPFFQLFYFNF